MNFAVKNLSVLAYAQGFTLWHYKAPGMALNALDAAGFFNHASDLLATGDILLMSAGDGGRVAFVAAANDGVTLAALG